MGLLRQGPTLPSANLRYRLRTLGNLRYYQKPTVTLILTHSDQATRRAFRTLGSPMEHRTTFVATEAELLAGDADSLVWQQCGTSTSTYLPMGIASDATLSGILAWAGRLVDNSAASRRRHGFEPDNRTTPDPDTLYPDHLQAAMPEPSEQVKTSLAVRLTRAEKEALDLLAA